MKSIDDDLGRLAIAQRLLQVRQYLGLSHADVGEVLGVASDEVAGIEAGTRAVDCLELQQLATLYACPPGYFLGTAGGATTALDRVLAELPVEDHERILQFAQLLRHQRTRAPRLRLVKPGEVPPTDRADGRRSDTAAHRTRRID